MHKKTSTMSMRISPDVKKLLVSAAAQEHRTIANMVEWMVLKYAEQLGLKDAPRIDMIAARMRRHRRDKETPEA